MAAPRIVTAALELRRRVYASLPWGYRLANLYLRLASEYTDGFGQAAYGLFLLYGVEGMPPIHGQPAELFKPKDVPDINRKVPLGYGAEFGARAFSSLLKFGADEERIRDLMTDCMVRLLHQKGNLSRVLSGAPLKDAENYVFKTLNHIGADSQIKLKRERGNSLVDEEGMEQAIEDPRAWKALEKHLPEKEIAAIRRELAKVSPKLAPDLPLYFDLLLAGYHDSEIVRDQMLPFLVANPMTQSGWSKKYKEGIKRVLRKHFDVN